MKSKSLHTIVFSIVHRLKQNKKILKAHIYRVHDWPYSKIETRETQTFNPWFLLK